MSPWLLLRLVALAGVVFAIINRLRGSSGGASPAPPPTPGTPIAPAPAGTPTTPGIGGTSPNPNPNPTPVPVPTPAPIPNPPPGNQPPAVTIQVPQGGIHSSPVIVRYLIADTESDLARIIVEYSPAPGVPFVPATEHSPLSQGTDNLSTTPNGQPHVYAWNAANDLSVLPAANVRLRITAHASGPGQPAVTSLFTVVAAVAAAPPPPPPLPWPPFPPISSPPTAPPGVSIPPRFTPDPGPRIPLRFAVSDPESQPVDITVEYKFGTGGWTVATPAPNSDGVTRVAAPYLSANYRFIWDAAADLGSPRQGSAVLRLTVRRGTLVTVEETPVFAVNTAPLEPPAPFTPKVPIVARMSVASGNNQTGVAGEFLQEVLRVLVADTNSRPVRGARVCFHALPAGSVTDPVTIHDDPNDATITNRDGFASVRIRARRGVASNGTITVNIKATLVGDETATVTFACTINQPRLEAQWPSDLVYGPPRSFTVGVVAMQNDPNVLEYAPDLQKPVRLLVRVTKGQASYRELLLLPSNHAPRVQVVPDDRNGPVEVEISAPDDPTIQTIRHTFTVSASDATRITSHLGTAVRVPLRLQSRTRSGPGSATHPGLKARVGWPGLTFDEDYQVEIFDGVDTYEQRTSVYTTDCQAPPQTPTIRVNWSASGGTISTTRAPGTSSTLQAEVTTPVFFTPAGPGPWLLTASIGDSVYDQNSSAYLIPNPGGPPDCRHHYNFRGQGQLVQTFIVQQASRPTLLDNQNNALDEVPVGEEVRFRIDGLSPVSGTPDPLHLLSTFITSNRPIPDYAGVPGYVKDQDVPLNVVAATPPRLESPFGLFLSGDPQSIPAAAWKHWVLPGGLLSVSADGIRTEIPVFKKRHERLDVSGIEPVQEALRGTSPKVGHGSSVALPSGEVLLNASDLDFETRIGTWTAGRTFRSQTTSVGPLGPGWCLEHDQRLGVNRPDRQLWIGPSGHVDAFNMDYAYLRNTPNHGVYAELTIQQTITSDASAYEIRDDDNTVWHFNIDGSLRFWIDRKSNRTEYRYDVKGRLQTVIDVHGRSITFDWGGGERLQKITDFASRTVDFSYYGSGHAAEDWLEKVTLPPVATQLAPGAAPSANYRRSVTYTYEVDATDKERGRLKAIKDSVGTDFVTYEYDAQGRVEKTIRGPAEYVITWLPGHEVRVADPDGKYAQFRFPFSPHPDAAAPDRKTDAGGTWESEYNVEGELTRSKTPDGDETRYSYDDVPRGGATQTPVPSRRGNLLAMRQIPTNGNPRTWRYRYRRPSNKVSAIVGPRGVDGECESLEETRVIFDDQVAAVSDPLLRAGNQQNPVKIIAPASQNMVVVPDGSGGHRQFWVEGNPMWRFRYNSFGQVIWEMDPYYVVTEYLYYPAATPTSGVPSSNGGGFVAVVRRDIMASAERSQYLSGVPVNTIEVRTTYDVLGHVQDTTDADGNTITTETNDLHEVTRITRSMAVPGSAQPASTERRLTYGIHGNNRMVTIPQPGANPDAGGPSLIREVIPDSHGNPIESRATFTANETASDRSILDKAGRMVGYDPMDQRSGLASSSSTRIELDDRGLVRTRKEGVDPQSNQATLASTTTHTAAGRPRDYTDPGNTQPATQHRDGYGSPRGTVDPLGNVQRTERDGSGHPTRIVEQYGQGGPNETARLIDPNNGVAPTLSFHERIVDENGRLTREHRGHYRLDNRDPVAATPGSVEFVDGPQPWPPATVPPDNDGGWGPGDGRASTDTMHDLRGQIVRVVEDDLSVSYIRRDAHGRPMEVSVYEPGASGTNRLVSLTKTSFSNGGDPLEVTTRLEPTDGATDQPVTLKVKHEYDPMHRVVRTIDGHGNAVRKEFDETGHVYARYDSVGPDSNDQYNGHSINRDGNLTTLDRDGMGRLRKVETTLTSDGSGGSALLTSNPFNTGGKVGYRTVYSPEGRQLSLTDMDGNTTNWRYDAQGRLEHTEYPAAASLGGLTRKSMTYDQATGRVETITEPNGARRTFRHDAAGRVIRIDTVDPSGATGGYAYRYLSDRVIMEDLNGRSQVEMVYDSQGRIDREIQGGHEVKSRYNGRGQRVGIEYPNNARSFTFVRDGMSRLRNIEENGARIARYEYVGPDWVSQRIHRSVGTRYTRQEGSGHLQGMEVTGVDGGTIDWALPPDRAGRKKSAMRTQAGRSEMREWTYDSAGRVTFERWTPATATAASPLETERLFDGDTVLRQERQDVVRPGGGVSVQNRSTQREERGRYVQFNGQTLRYDASGNLTSDGAKTYEWDAWGRLITVKRGGTTLATYVYDGKHRLISKTTGSGTEDYIYDGHQLIEIRDGAQVVERYIYSDQLDDLIEVELAGVPHLVTYSPNGHVDALLDINGRIVQRYEYDLSGRLLILDAQGNVQFNARPLCRMLFQRHYFDADIGLYWFRQRWYHPEINSFLSPDPMGFNEGPNLYGLCHGDCVNAADPFGTWTWGQVLGITAAIVIGTAVTVATAGFAGPIVGAGLATVIGGAVGGAAGGFIGTAVETKFDKGEVDWGAAATSAAIGGALGAAFAIGALAAFSGPARALASSVAGSAVGRAVGAGASFVAGLGRSAGTSIASTTVYQIAATAGRAVGGPVLNAGGRVVHAYGAAVRAITGRAEELGARAALRIHQSSLGSRLAGRGIPIIDDAVDSMMMKIHAAEGQALGEDVFMVRNAARLGHENLTHEGATYLFDDYVRVQTTAHPDIFRIARFTSSTESSWGLHAAKFGGGLQPTYHSVARSSHRGFFAAWEAADEALQALPLSSRAAMFNNLGDRRYLWPLWLSDVPKRLTGAAAGLVTWFNSDGG